MAHPQVPAGLAVTTAWAPPTHTAHTTQTPARGICPVAAEACPVSLKGQAPEGAGLTAHPEMPFAKPPPRQPLLPGRRPRRWPSLARPLLDRGAERLRLPGSRPLETPSPRTGPGPTQANTQGRRSCMNEPVPCWAVTTHSPSVREEVASVCPPSPCSAFCPAEGSRGWGQRR